MAWEVFVDPTAAVLHHILLRTSNGVLAIPSAIRCRENKQTPKIHN